MITVTDVINQMSCGWVSFSSSPLCSVGKIGSGEPSWSIKKNQNPKSISKYEKKNLIKGKEILLLNEKEQKKNINWLRVKI